jgi:hypothetical protein
LEDQCRVVEDKYLNVLEHAKNVPKTNDVMVARLGYREVATHYGCAYENDGYRVMEEMAECVPGVSYKMYWTLSVECVIFLLGVVSEDEKGEDAGSAYVFEYIPMWVRCPPKRQ